jgi:hypothetical protein
MDNFSKLQKLEKETNQALSALSISATETKKLSIAAAKSAEKLEAEAAKICESVKSVVENADILASVTVALSKK